MTQRHIGALLACLWLVCAALLLNGAVVRIPPARQSAVRVQAAGVVASTGTGTAADVDRTNMQFEWLAKNIFDLGASARQYLPDTGPGANHWLEQSNNALKLPTGTDASGAVYIYNSDSKRALVGASSTVLFPTDQSVKNFTIAIAASWAKNNTAHYGFLFIDSLDKNEWYFNPNSFTYVTQGVDGHNTPRANFDCSSSLGFHVFWLWGNDTGNAGAGSIQWQIDGGAATEFRTANSGILVHVPILFNANGVSGAETGADPSFLLYGMRGWARLLSQTEMAEYSAKTYWD